MTDDTEVGPDKVLGTVPDQVPQEFANQVPE